MNKFKISSGQVIPNIYINLSVFLLNLFHRLGWLDIKIIFIGNPRIAGVFFLIPLFVY